MSRERDINVFRLTHDSAGGDLDTDSEYFSCSRPILVRKVTFLGVNPSDTDGDTTAITVDYSAANDGTYGVNIATLAAQEYNDTDVHAQFGGAAAKTAFGIAVDVPMTAAALAASPPGVRVPAGCPVRIVATNVGAGADTRFSVEVEYTVL